jgi:hypothetical protein
MGTLWLIMYIVLPVFAVLIIPFFFFWYDSESTEDARCRPPAPCAALGPHSPPPAAR